MMVIIIIISLHRVASTVTCPACAAVVPCDTEVRDIAPGRHGQTRNRLPGRHAADERTRLHVPDAQRAVRRRRQQLHGQNPRVGLTVLACRCHLPMASAFTVRQTWLSFSPAKRAADTAFWWPRSTVASVQVSRL
jgi:hypothetical protein